VALIATAELRFYFGPYASSDRWPWNRVEGETVAAEGATGWAITVGGYAHMANSGWVRLLAPNAHRWTVPTPGLDLPLALPAERDLSFLLYSGQPYYLPYLQELYPGGTSRETHTPELQPVVTVYRVPLAKWGPLRGAFASTPGANALHAPSLGQPPAGWTSFPAPMRWSAALRVPYSGNFSFRADGRVDVDGREILRADRGKPFAETTVSLPRGDHRVVFEGTVAAPGQPALFEWKGDDPGEPWRRTVATELWAMDGPPQGLLGVFTAPQGPARKSLDSTIAAMSLNQEVVLDGDWTASWRGTLLAPEDGSYIFGFRTHGGAVEMGLDGKTVWTTRGAEEKIERSGAITLQKGPHEVAILYRVAQSPGGIEWIWTPPGKQESLVPPAALRPPADAGPGPPLSDKALEGARSYRHASLATVAP
jgi:hypothetical protein